MCRSFAPFYAHSFPVKRNLFLIRIVGGAGEYVSTPSERQNYIPDRSPLAHSHLGAVSGLQSSSWCMFYSRRPTQTQRRCKLHMQWPQTGTHVPRSLRHRAGDSQILNPNFLIIAPLTFIQLNFSWDFLGTVGPCKNNQGYCGASPQAVHCRVLRVQ